MSWVICFKTNIIMHVLLLFACIANNINLKLIKKEHLLTGLQVDILNSYI